MLSDTFIVRAQGEIDIGSAHILEDALARGTDLAEHIIIDLTETKYLDSSGIDLLFEHARRSTHRRQGVALVVSSRAVIRPVLDIVMMRERIPIFETMQAAIDALKEAS
jgi:anti-anti-sigma factor